MQLEPQKRKYIKVKCSDCGEIIERTMKQKRNVCYTCKEKIKKEWRKTRLSSGHRLDKPTA